MLVAIAMVALFAFARLFTTFVPWDDEGYFLLAYRDVLSGRVPYAEVFSWYGPAMFLMAALVSGFAVENVTHDALRWVTLPAWIAIAALMAGTVWRWTRDFAATLAAFVVIGLQLGGLAKSVGHPQLWAILATAMLVLVGAGWISRRGSERYGFVVGVLLAALCLLKTNLGLLAALAVTLALGCHLLPGAPAPVAARAGQRKVAAVPLALLGAVPGLALLMAAASTSAEKYFAIAYMVSLGTIVFEASSRAMLRRPSVRGALYLLAGFGTCSVVVIGWVFAQGTSPAALYDGLIASPKALAQSYHYPFREPARTYSSALSVAGLGLAAALGWSHLVVPSRLAWGIIKALVGAGLLVAFLYDHRLALTGSLLFLWLLVGGRDSQAAGYSDRLFLALLAATLSLQLYPVAGEQVDWAALLPMMAAAVLLADGIAAIRAVRAPRAPRAIVSVARAGALVVAVICAADLAFNTARSWHRWQISEPLLLPGARWLRLPTSDAARLRSTVRVLGENCSAALMLPGLYSFSIWSAVPPIERRRINTWPFLWPDEQLSSSLRQPRSCVLVDREIYDFFARIAVAPDHRLLSEIRGLASPFAAVEDIEVYRVR